MPTVPQAAESDSRATAHYIEDMAKELRTLAAKANLGFLAYLLGMVEDDASATAAGLEGSAPRGEDARPHLRLHSSSSDTR